MCIIKSALLMMMLTLLPHSVPLSAISNADYNASALAATAAKLKITKGQLDQAKAEGTMLVKKIQELNAQLLQYQKELAEAVKAGSALSQELECVKGACSAKLQEYETKIQLLIDEHQQQLRQELKDMGLDPEKVCAV